MNIYLVEMDGMAVRAFSTRELAYRYIHCCLEEWDDELNQYRYDDYAFDVVEIPLDEK